MDPNQNFSGGRAVQRRRSIDIEKWEAKGKFGLKCSNCWDTVFENGNRIHGTRGR